MCSLSRFVVAGLICSGLLPTESALAERSKATGTVTIRASKKQFPYGTDLNLFQRYVATPIVQTLKGVQKGTLVYQRENPDKTAKVKERYEDVNVRALYDQWTAHRDAYAVPLQRRSYEVRNTNYGEYQRLNDEAMRIMNAKERELFGPVGLDLIRASDIAYGSGHISVKRSYVEQPPQHLFDERVPAAKTILDRASTDQSYRRKLASCLASPVKLAAFLDDYNNHPSPWGTARLNTNQQLYSDLSKLMGKAVTWSGPDLIRGAAREASLLLPSRRR
jgi:hypothetical protein